MRRDLSPFPREGEPGPVGERLDWLKSLQSMKKSKRNVVISKRVTL